MQRTNDAQDRRTAAAQRGLLDRARAGDAAAFDAIVATRLPAVWRLARGILGGNGDADDAASCAMVAAWHELPRLEDLDRFDDWLDRIVISECRMRLGATATAGSAAEMPEDLVARTLDAVRERPRRVPQRDGRRRVLAGIALAVPILVVALVAAWGLGAFKGMGGPGLESPGPSGQAAAGPGTAAGASPSGPGGSGGTASPSGATPPLTGASPAPSARLELGPGAIAVVTLDGDNLRVRTTPGVSDPKTRLKPLLPAGTRMLIVDGPVTVDGLDWYEVQTDGELVNLFGWVAAGDNGEAWIAPAAPRCWGSLGAGTLAGLDRVDFLACYGRTEVKVRARAEGLWDVRAHAGDCGWVRASGVCEMDNAWLLLPAAPVAVITDAGTEHQVMLAMPPDLSEALLKLPRQSTLLLTVSMDAPEADACRARDADTGAALIPDDQAITACRLQFVVQEVAFREPAGSPSPDAPAN